AISRVRGPTSVTKSSLLSGSITGPHPVARTLQALEGVLCTDLAISDATQHGIQLVKLQLAHVDVTEKKGGEGLEWLRRFHQPLQDGVRVDLKHPGRGTNAQALRQAGEHAHDQLHRHPFAMKNRAVRLQKVSRTRATVQLAPWAAAGMAVGA